jgi:hypothetical protein
MSDTKFARKIIRTCVSLFCVASFKVGGIHCKPSHAGCYRPHQFLNYNRPRDARAHVVLSIVVPSIVCLPSAFQSIFGVEGTATLKTRPESGRVRLVCAMIARRRHVRADQLPPLPQGRRTAVSLKPNPHGREGERATNALS